MCAQASAIHFLNINFRTKQDTGGNKDCEFIVKQFSRPGFGLIRFYLFRYWLANKKDFHPVSLPAYDLDTNRIVKVAV